MVERSLSMREVRGSIPRISILWLLLFFSIMRFLHNNPMLGHQLPLFLFLEPKEKPMSHVCKSRGLPNVFSFFSYVNRCCLCFKKKRCCYDVKKVVSLCFVHIGAVRFSIQMSHLNEDESFCLFRHWKYKSFRWLI